MHFIEKIKLLLWNSLLVDRSILYGKDLQHGTKILIMLAQCFQTPINMLKIMQA